MNRRIFKPVKGWKMQTWYLVKVSFGSGNVIHRALFYTGFLNNDGEPEGYNMLISPGYEDRHEYREVWYLETIREVVSAEDMKSSFRLPIETVKEDSNESL